LAQDEKLWKNKPGILTEHCSGYCATLAALVTFQKKSTNIDLLLDKGHGNNLIEQEAETQPNRESIKILLDITRTLPLQGIAFCGSLSEKDRTRNFCQIVNLLSTTFLMPQSDFTQLTALVQI
jgi:hypothetical protein